MNTTPTISIEVLICTHNRLKLLKRTINYLNEAERPLNCIISILVIANACTDGTNDYLRNYTERQDEGDKLSLNWYNEKLPGKSNALNLGRNKLQAAIIAMVDDDHRVDKDYFRAIYNSVIQYPNADFFCGKIMPDWDGTEPEWVHDQGKYRIYPLPVPHFDLGEQNIQVSRSIAVPGGGNLVIKRELMENIGPFLTDLGPVGHSLGGSEDYEWVVRAYNSEACLIYIPKIVQYHYVDTGRLTLSYIIKKAYERSASVVRLNKNAQNFAGLFPLYLIKKIIIYLTNALLSMGHDKRRFFLVRTAATLGEIKGFFIAKRDSV